jgi:hypothetical protein
VYAGGQLLLDLEGMLTVYTVVCSTVGIGSRLTWSREMTHSSEGRSPSSSAAGLAGPRSRLL